MTIETIARRIGHLPQTIRHLPRTAEDVQCPVLVSQVSEMLTPRLATLIAGLNTTKTLESWASRDNIKVPADKEERLRTAYIIGKMLRSDYSDRIIRQWFVGTNRKLRTSPALAIRNRRFQEAIDAAEDFLAD